MKSLSWTVASAAVFCCSAAAADPKMALPAPPAWAIAPTDAACRTDMELVARSGEAVEVVLESDGDRVALRFGRGEIPASAFLPIRIDGRAFSNLVRATEDPKIAAMTLSDETLAAMRKGGVLQVAWLAGEALKSSLGVAAQGLTDLKTCGMQVAAQARAQAAQMQLDRAQTAAQAHAKALADEQLATARAQTAAAQAEQRRLTAEADRAAAEADRQRALAQAERELARQQATAEDEDNPQRYRAAQPAPWGYYDDRYGRR